MLNVRNSVKTESNVDEMSITVVEGNEDTTEMDSGQYFQKIPPKPSTIEKPAKKHPEKLPEKQLQKSASLTLAESRLLPNPLPTSTESSGECWVGISDEVVRHRLWHSLE